MPLLEATGSSPRQSPSGTNAAPRRRADGAATRSTVLTEAQEVLIVEFRQRTLLPLDDLLSCLREPIPTLTRSALHRCLQRHGISRLPRDGPPAKRGRFADTQLGYVHLDSCQVRSAEGKRHLVLP